MNFIAGVDEVGRGPLAGPVIAAAVILNIQKPIIGLKDSKKLSERKRQELSLVIQRDALFYAFGSASVEEIDQFNILQASLLAMKRAVENLSVVPDQVFVDGQFCPNIHCPVQAIIKGDQKIPEISAASIIAKVYRDQLMLDFDVLYPHYHFAKHKGYPTKEHLEALKQFGISLIHRRSFGPIQQYI